MMADRTRGLAAAAALACLALPLTGCGGSDPAKPAKATSPAAALAKAKAKFDSSSSVHLTLSTDSKPTSGDAVLGADGTLTHQPAFDGKVKVTLSGFNAEVPIIAVGGKVYAKLPLTPTYAEINPAEYSSPDPAQFADTSKGISGLLLKMDGLKSDGTKREGKQVLTRYAGTLKGSYVAPIIPSAKPGGSYVTVVGVDGHDQITTLEVTGEFFAGGGDETYDLTFDDYGKNVKISAP